MRPCWAQESGDWCRNHDPAEAERRRRAGGVRHPRFNRPQVPVDGELVDAKNAPTVASVIDHALRVADEVQEGTLEPRQAQAAVAALKLAHEALVGEREYADKKRWAWEEWQRARSQQGTARENTAPGDGGANSEQPTASPPPPWMQPRPTN